MAELKRILIAEDDVAEQDFIIEGFRKSGVFEILDIVANGHQLLGKLQNLEKKDLPDVILSDINMPLMTGFEALVKVKKDPNLSEIPFVIFSTSKEETTRSTSMNLGADQFLVKPESFNDYERFAKKLHELVSKN